MKKDFEQSKLLDALLADETWDTCSGRLQSNAIAAVRATKKSRARRTVAIQIMAVLAVVAAALSRDGVGGRVPDADLDETICARWRRRSRAGGGESKRSVCSGGGAEVPGGDLIRGGAARAHGHIRRE